MTRRPILFLTSAIVAFAVVVGIWLTVFLYQPVPPTVPAGQTAAADGVNWHLDFMKQVSADDPVLQAAGVITIDGAAYVMVQISRDSADPVMICSTRLVGVGRQWSTNGVYDPSGTISPSCTKATKATQQWAVAIPPSAVKEIQAVDVNINGGWVRLEGPVD